MPGIVIGSIFIFVLTMGEYGTVQVVGAGHGHLGRDDHPEHDRRHPVPAGRRVGGAARARPDRSACSSSPASRTCGRSCDQHGRSPAGRDRPQDRVIRREHEAPPRLGEVGPRRLLRRLPASSSTRPMILMAILSFQGYYGGVTFPFIGPFSLDWWRSLFETRSSAAHARTPMRSGPPAMQLAVAQPRGRRGRRVPRASRSRWRSGAALPGRRRRLLPDHAGADDARASCSGSARSSSGRRSASTPSLWHDGARDEHRSGGSRSASWSWSRSGTATTPHRGGGARSRRRRSDGRSAR